MRREFKIHQARKSLFPPYCSFFYGFLFLPFAVLCHRAQIFLGHMYIISRDALFDKDCAPERSMHPAISVNDTSQTTLKGPMGSVASVIKKARVIDPSMFRLHRKPAKPPHLRFVGAGHITSRAAGLSMRHGTRLLSAYVTCHADPGDSGEDFRLEVKKWETW